MGRTDAEAAVQCPIDRLYTYLEDGAAGNTISFGDNAEEANNLL